MHCISGLVIYLFITLLYYNAYKHKTACVNPCNFVLIFRTLRELVIRDYPNKIIV